MNEQMKFECMGCKKPVQKVILHGRAAWPNLCEDCQKAVRDNYQRIIMSQQAADEDYYRDIEG